MRRERGLTLIEVVVVVLVLAALAGLVGLLLHSLARGRSEARRIRCANNLNQLAKGMATYLNEHGDNRFYPWPLGLGARPNDFNGAEWLASLYWTGVVPDPGVFICPSSDDTNHDGQDLGSRREAPTFGPQSVSYAGLHYYSLISEAKSEPRPLLDDFPPDTPMASDDTQGTINHDEPGYRGMFISFMGGGSEFKTDKEIDVEHAVGMKGGLLWQLRN